MINVAELRLGNYLLQKVNNRVTTVKCTYAHFELISLQGAKDLYPILLNAEVLEQCGFSENPDYPLLPSAREFSLMLPVPGVNKNTIQAYIKSNKECFGRAAVNGLPASVNYFHLHQLQNLYFSLTGRELPVVL